MKPSEFITKYMPYAQQCQQQTGISAIATLAQAALESGWGEHAPGNMFFGVKDTDGLNGNEQLVPTFEYSKNNMLTAPQIGLDSIDSITPTTINGAKFFIYRGKAYFRKYDTPADSFIEHARFFLNNRRYSAALAVKADPYAFADAIAQAGYAQSPTYAGTLRTLIKMITDIINRN